MEDEELIKELAKKTYDELNYYKGVVEGLLMRKKVLLNK